LIEMPDFQHKKYALVSDWQIGLKLIVNVIMMLQYKISWQPPTGPS